STGPRGAHPRAPRAAWHPLGAAQLRAQRHVQEPPPGDHTMSPLVKHGRRHFLRTLGGAALALPVLPSLLSPSEARAATASKGPRFICMGTQHGGVWGD